MQVCIETFSVIACQKKSIMGQPVFQSSDLSLANDTWPHMAAISNRTAAPHQFCIKTIVQYRYRMSKFAANQVDESMGQAVPILCWRQLEYILAVPWVQNPEPDFHDLFRGNLLLHEIYTEWFLPILL